MAANLRHNGKTLNPAAKLWPRPGNALHAPQDPRYPYIFTTYRLTELHCGGIAMRVMPHTAELQPEAFIEISPELAAETDIANLDWAVLSTELTPDGREMLAAMKRQAQLAAAD